MGYEIKQTLNMDNKNIVIRKAERQDVPLLLEFIRGIATIVSLKIVKIQN